MVLDPTQLHSPVLLAGGLGLLAGCLLGLLLGFLLGRRGLQRARIRCGALAARLEAREEAHQQQLRALGQDRAQLQREFERLADRILAQRSEQLGKTSRRSLETTLQPLKEQLEGFRRRVDQVHSEAVKGQGALEAEIRKVLDVGLNMSEQADHLGRALRGDKKVLGNWGEAQLEKSLQLAGLEPGQHYQAQASLRDTAGQRRLPDFIVHLPHDKHLVIDSKASLVAFDQAINAEDDTLRKAALDSHCKALRKHVEELSGKRYAALPGLDSPDFVLMFIPLEPAYLEALRHDTSLYDHAYRKGVALVSHTTLMPIMRTVAQLWATEKSHSEARQLSARAGELYNQVCVVTERLQRLGNSLRAAGNQYNDTLRSLQGRQGLQGKVARFRQFSTGTARDMAEPSPIEVTIATPSQGEQA